MQIMKVVLSAIFFLQVCTFASAQQYLTLEECKINYNDALYETIIPSLDNFSGDVYRQNSFTINFMLGSCLCRTGNTDRGPKILKWIVSNYDLDPKQLRIIRREISDCGSSDAGHPDISALALWYNRNSNAGVRSKTFINFDPEETNASSSSRLIDSSLNNEFPMRIKRLDTWTANDSVQIDRKLIPNFYVSDHFLLFGDKSKTAESLKVISGELERTLDFYLSFFQFKLPENYINVYVLSSVGELGRFAKTCHRIKLSENTLGYAFELDNSISGALPSIPAGTLKHELLHLLMHSNFQAVPPWMDEGLSALYEVSVFNDSVLTGMHNWRGNIIKSNLGEVQSGEFSPLKILTDYSWEKSTRAERYQPLINAVMRYFFLYLQEIDLLQSYVLAIKEYSPDNSERFFIEELEKVSGMSLNDLNKQYYQWLAETVK
jgi:hypothetical protein